MTSPDFSDASNMDLANVIHALGGLTFHADRRARKERRDPSEEIEQLRQQSLVAIDLLKSRTGITSDRALGMYVDGLRRKQEASWDETWDTVSVEGIVFKYNDYTFETLRAYGVPQGTSVPNSYVLARVHEEPRLHLFIDRDVTGMKVLYQDPRYAKHPVAGNGPEWRGLLRFDEALEARTKAPPVAKPSGWHSFDPFYRSAFRHVGLNEEFQAIERVARRDAEQSEANEILLARSYTRPLVAEFTPADLPFMERVKPRAPIVDGLGLYK